MKKKSLANILAGVETFHRSHKNSPTFQNSATYSFTKDRGVKCCKVDMSRAQSNITVVSLN